MSRPARATILAPQSLEGRTLRSGFTARLIPEHPSGLHALVLDSLATPLPSGTMLGRGGAKPDRNPVGVTKVIERPGRRPLRPTIPDEHYPGEGQAGRPMTLWDGHVWSMLPVPAADGMSEGHTAMTLASPGGEPAPGGAPSASDAMRHVGMPTAGSPTPPDKTSTILMNHASPAVTAQGNSGFAGTLAVMTRSPLNRGKDDGRMTWGEGDGTGLAVALNMGLDVGVTPTVEIAPRGPLFTEAAMPADGRHVPRPARITSNDPYDVTQGEGQTSAEERPREPPNIPARHERESLNATRLAAALRLLAVSLLVWIQTRWKPLDGSTQGASPGLPHEWRAWGLRWTPLARPKIDNSSLLSRQPLSTLLPR